MCRKKPDLHYVNGSVKVMVDLHPAPDLRQKLTTSRGSPRSHAYHVQPTSVTAIVSYPAHRQNDRTNDNLTQPALAELDYKHKLMAVWLNGNALASINVVALRQTRLVLGWVTVCGRVNHFGM